MKKFYFIILLFLISISCSTDDTSSSETDNESTEENDVAGNKISVPDNNFEQWLIDNNYDDVLDNYALTDNLNTIKKFCVEDMNINDLTGLKAMTAVEEICIDGGNFDSIDLSNNTQLKTLKIINTSLTSVDLRVNKNLVDVDLANNKLQELIVGDKRSLKTLSAQGNDLDFLNINEVYSLENLNTTNNNIECVVVNYPQMHGLNNNWQRDEETIPAIYCSSDPNNPSKENYTYIPDRYFEEYLILQGLDDEEDGFVLTENISEIERISIGDNTTNIFSLKGIEDFKELTHLFVPDAIFYTLDLSENVKLQEVHIRGNNLQSINLKENKDLELLIVRSNLQSVDLTNNEKLEYLSLEDNQLTEIDLSSNPNITNLNLGDNNFESLNITAQTILKTLTLSRNNLSNINFSNVQKIYDLDVSNNNLEKLDLSPISSKIDYIAAYNNNLSCIQINENQMSNGRFWGSTNLDEETTFSLNCNY